MTTADCDDALLVRALRVRQGDGVDVYAFFLRGSDILRVADIARIRRDGDYVLHGFQRDEIKNHVSGIVEYLNRGSVIFPNAIIFALAPEVRFTHSRGPAPSGLQDIVHAGTLSIPVRPEGTRVAWIVDGQQRSMALARATNREVVVPVVGFISDDIDTHREQFILVNKAKPLPSRLIDELLPETTSTFPRELSANKLPSELCNLLNQRSGAPFYKLIRRKSDRQAEGRVVIDTAVVKMIRSSINSPTGALVPFKGSASAPADINSMYRLLCVFWSAVKDTFPDAWGLSPVESRLMHSAGIEAMGHLMDRIVTRSMEAENQEQFIRNSLERIAPHCRWCSGVWEGSRKLWNEIQSTPSDIKALSDELARIDFETLRRPA